MLQNLMRGDNSGLDYSDFRDSSVNTARYRGDRSESLYGSPVLEPAHEEGRITQVRFYVDYDDGTVEKPVQVQAYNDGHINTTKPTQEDFLNELEGHLAAIRDHREFLDPLDDLIDEYVYQAFGGSFASPEEVHRERVNRAFSSLVNNYFDEDDYQDEERHVFESIIANTGIELSKLDLEDDSYPNVDEDETLPYQDGRIEEFFEKYAVTAEETTRPDFDKLSSHLHALLHQRWDTPLEIIEEAIDDYALR
ncbi:hypothetical protein SAMN06264855_1163 [Halorubrum vacuolatum]|uniref:Uncharacterized protein n=2 Tax=Halorubrum vacuolatum TaxID=63740 RepID=A0A238XD43_HALVU|nr:hypothetical protein SAMN06264855_1163 [Halorubrum vacuolatum]